MKRQTNAEEILRGLNQPSVKYEAGKRPNFTTFLDLQKYMLKMPAERIDELIEENEQEHRSLELKAVSLKMEIEQQIEKRALSIDELNQKRLS